MNLIERQESHGFWRYGNRLPGGDLTKKAAVSLFAKLDANNPPIGLDRDMAAM